MTALPLPTPVIAPSRGPWTAPRILAAASIALFGLWRLTNEITAPAAFPVAAIIVVMATFAIVLSKRENGDLPYFEVGFFFATIVSIYPIYALLTAISLDLRFTPLSDARLWLSQPTADELARAGWMNVTLLATFAAVYLGVRGRTPPVARAATKPDSAALVILITLYILIKLYFLFLVALFGLRFESYSDQYLAYRALPLVFAQLANHLGGMISSIQLLLLFCLFTAYKKNRTVIFVWLGVATAMAFLRLGSRTELFLLLLSAMIVYHRLVRPLSGRVVITLGVSSLLGFLILGFLRVLNEGGETGVGSGSEFDALFATAIDLARRRDFNAIIDAPRTLYFNDFLSLIPQQIMPFKKVDLPTWYVRTYYPSMYFNGGGYAFGMIAESIIGNGWPDLIARSALLGACLGGFHRWFAGQKQTIWTFALYTWVTAISYQSYRNSTLTPMIYLWYRFLPLYLVVVLFAPVIRSAMGGRRSSAGERSPTPAEPAPA